MAIIQMLCFCSSDCNTQVSPQSCFCPSPTSEPTAVPTSAPSGASSSAGTPVPSRSLSSAVPSRAPSAAPSRPPPFQPTLETITKLSFTFVSKVDGINASTFLNEPAYQLAYLDTTAAVLNVSAGAVFINGVTDEGRRLLQRESMLRGLSSDMSIMVEAKIAVTLEEAGLSSSDSEATFQTLRWHFLTAVISGDFGRELSTAAIRQGLDASAMRSDAAFIPTFSAPEIVEERTANPSASPTDSPTTIKIVTERDSSYTTLIIIVAFVSVFFGLVVGGAFIYGLSQRRADAKYESASVAICG